MLNFQPSELAKLVMTMYAASYMVRKMDVKEDFIKAVWPMAVALAVIGLLLLAEPDMGAYVVIAAIAMGILFLGGVNMRMFLLVCAVLSARVRRDDRVQRLARRPHLGLARPVEREVRARAAPTSSRTR